jgi:site-specific recombinase XerD
MTVRDRAILRLMVETGVRAGELCALTREHINIDDDPHVRVIGKGDKEREVGPLSPECCRDIRRYLRVQPRQPHEALFISRYRQAMTINGLDQMLYRLRDAAGLEGTEVRAHVLRHTYAVRALRAGMDIKRLSLLMGHSTVAVTERYVRDFQQREARRPVTGQHSERQQSPKRR